MLERMSVYYGKEAAAKELPRDALEDNDFCIFLDDTLGQMRDEEDFDEEDFKEHLIDCWERSYDDYKNGKVI